MHTNYIHTYSTYTHTYIQYIHAYIHTYIPTSILLKLGQHGRPIAQGTNKIDRKIQTDKQNKHRSNRHNAKILIAMYTLKIKCTRYHV